MVAGVLLAAAAIVVAVWAWVGRPLRVPARGGVVGREGRGVLVRDGDGLVFLRRARRFVVPLSLEPDRAVRRFLTGARESRRSGSSEIAADVFRGPDHVVHTVAVLDSRGAARLTAPAGVGRRLT